MSSSDALPAPLRRDLLDVAFAAIRGGFDGVRPLVDAARFAPPLRQPRASFVTLHVDATLRGCIGTLDARRPLVEDVAFNAYAAAFEDARFAPIGRSEFPRLTAHVSLLHAPEPIAYRDEADLLARLRPGVDGVVLRAGHRRATFLPSVWNQLNGPSEFLRHLKRKAGLDENYWSGDLSFERYTVEDFEGKPAAEIARSSP